MANRTDPLAKAVHGTNPQNLIENIVRQRIYEQMYWKEECFALRPDTLLEKAVELRCVGGTHGGQRKATKFLCLVLKLLQLQPDKEIVYEYIANEEFKYVRLLGAFYLRLVGTAKEIYEYLDPLYHDFRKVRCLNPDGTFGLLHVDEIIQDLLSKDFLYDTALPRLPYRHTLVSVGRMKPRVSALAADFEAVRVELEEKKSRREEELLQRKKENEALEQEEGEAAAAAAAAAATTSSRRRERNPRDFRGSRDGEGHRHRHGDRDRGSGGHRDDRENRGRRDREDERRHHSSHHRRRGDGDDDRDRKRHRRRSPGERSRSPAHHHSRDRDRDRDRREHRKRSKSGRDERSKHHSEKKKGKEEGGGRDQSKEDLAIQEANALRAKLGLKPLRM